MKKKVLWITMIISALFAIGGMHPQKIQAAPWGAKQLFTTPKATRGTWYYKENHRTKKWRITAHTSNGRKLYKILSEKQSETWYKKLINHSTKRNIQITNYLDKTMWEAYSFKWHGHNGFNSNAWLAGAGDGIYYVPVTRYHNGKRVKALRFGGGARNWLMFYAYKKQRKVSRKRTKKPISTKATFSKDGDKATLITNKFSISLDNSAARIEPNRLEISFTFKNLGQKSLLNDDLQIDLNNCVSVYQGNQYLNLKQVKAVSAISTGESVQVPFESNQIQNSNEPVRVIFSDPKSGKQLGTFTLNTNNIKKENNESINSNDLKSGSNKTNNVGFQWPASVDSSIFAKADYIRTLSGSERKAADLQLMRELDMTFPNGDPTVSIAEFEKQLFKIADDAKAEQNWIDQGSESPLIFK